jgi:hypothetical protein
MTQGLVPEHPPPFHPAKEYPVDAVAVKVTWVAAGKAAEHKLLALAEQFIPAGTLVMRPAFAAGATTMS